MISVQLVEPSEVGEQVSQIPSGLHLKSLVA